MPPKSLLLHALRIKSSWHRKFAYIALFFFALVLRSGLSSPAPDPEAQQHASRGYKLARQGNLKEAENELRRAAELAPEDPQILAGLGGILGLQQRLKEAEVYFEKAIKLDPKNLMLRRNLAANQWQLGQLQPARENLERILKARPGDPPSSLLLGMVMENLKDYARAADLLGSVPSLVEQRPESLSALARAYYKIGQKEKARSTLQALQKHPGGPAAIFMGGQIAAQADDYEVAEKMLVSIQSTYPNTALLSYNIALVQYRAGKLGEAQERLVGLIQAGNATSEVYNLLGWCYQKQDKPEEARHALQQAIERDPTRESNYLDLGMILASHRLFPAALAVAKRNVERHPASYHAHILKGLVELKMDQYTDAVSSYERAVELDPSNPEADRGLGVAQFAAGMIDQAKTTFEKGLRQFPQDAGHYQEYSRMLFKLAEAGDPSAEARAVELMKSALKLDSSLSEPHYYPGNQALQKGNLKEATQHLEAAARLDLNSSKLHYALARVYRRLGRDQEAAKEMERYRELKAAEEKSLPGFSAVVVKN